MKRVFLVMLSVVFFVSSTFAQLPPAQMRARLAGKVEKAAQEASVKNLQEARSTLAIAYLSGMFGVVDEVLTQYPKLVNETIKGEDGKPIPMVYHAFTRDKRYLSHVIQPIEKDLEKDLAEQKKKFAKWIDIRWERDLDLDHYEFDAIMPMIIADGIENAPLYIFGIPAAYDIIALVVNGVYGLGFLGYNGVGLVIANSKANRLYREGKSLSTQLEELRKKTHDRFSMPNLMLLTFYKHGAQCPRCYAESLKDGDLTVSEALTLSYYLPTYGATAKEILKSGKNKYTATILAKEIRVTESTLPELVAEAPWVVKIILERAVSNEPTVQKQIREYRTAYKEILSRLKRANAQQDDYLKDVKAIISSFDGHLDIALMFMKKFPNADIKEVKYVKHSFIIPVVRVKDKVYDARPETFGKLFPTS